MAPIPLAPLILTPATNKRVIDIQPLQDLLVHNLSASLLGYSEAIGSGDAYGGVPCEIAYVSRIGLEAAIKAAKAEQEIRVRWENQEDVQTEGVLDDPMEAWYRTILEHYLRYRPGQYEFIRAPRRPE